MSAVRGRVRDGRVELENELPEGSDVVVLTTTSLEENFDLAEAEIVELEVRIAAAHRGELEPAAAVFEKLRSAR